MADVRIQIGTGPMPIVYAGDGTEWRTAYYGDDAYAPQEWPLALLLIADMRGLLRPLPPSVLAALDLVQPDVLSARLRADCEAADRAVADVRSAPESDTLVQLGDAGQRVCGYIADGALTVGRVRVAETRRWIYPAIWSLALAGQIDAATVTPDAVVRAIAPRLCCGEDRSKMAAAVSMYLDALRRAAQATWALDMRRGSCAAGRS